MFYAHNQPPEKASNQSLADNVRPAGWPNPEPAPCYNLVVIGAGSAGLVTAAGAAGLGARVALIERQSMGGDCLNFGCVPSKGLIRCGRAVAEARNAHRFGATGTDKIDADFSAAMAHMQSVRATISQHDSATRFQHELGVDVFFGEGRFTSPDTLTVGGKSLRFRKAAICTGARASAPPIPGLEKTGYLTNETVFDLQKLPPRLAIIGAGPIGCELAQAFARLGSQVTVLEYGKGVLPREDREAAGIVEQAMTREGVTIHFECRTRQISQQGHDKIIQADLADGPLTLAVDDILVAIGRAPNVDGLGLEQAGVQFDSKTGIRVDERLRTSNRRIYAAGDVCSPYKFTHTADAMARILLANALFHGRQTSRNMVIPWVTYTSPEVAHVGLYENEARQQGYAVTTMTVPLAEVDRALIDGETEGFARVHLKKGSDKILGATIVAAHAGEMIGEMALAISAGLGLGSIGKTIHPYPTQSEILRKLADSYQRSRLTPGLKKVLNAWFRWRRY
jgi:pyruvate/2-oxoglutarate dehydrogenase complex dihydrolipoamide dehydrogenase (E3) component